MGYTLPHTHSVLCTSKQTCNISHVNVVHLNGLMTDIGKKLTEYNMEYATVDTVGCSRKGNIQCTTHCLHFVLTHTGTVSSTCTVQYTCVQHQKSSHLLKYCLRNYIFQHLHVYTVMCNTGLHQHETI